MFIARSGIQGNSSEETGTFSEDAPDQDEAEVEEFGRTDELAGKPGSQDDKDGLMHTVLEADSNSIDIGNMVMDAVNNGGSMFTPELLMEKLVKDYRSAEKLFGPTMIRQLTGYDPSYVEKNVKIPEFRREMEKQIKENAKELEKQGVLSKSGGFTEEAMELATVVLAVQELDHLTAQGMMGKRVHKKHRVDGTREETKPYAKEPYRNINVAQSVKTALRRGHNSLVREDLRSYEREGRGKQQVIYAIDASGSMKGQKIAQAKRAGVALAYTAIREGDQVGMLAFGKDVERAVPPCSDFSALLPVIARLSTGSETDIAACIRHATTLFTGKDNTKHLILLTDALATVGNDPTEDVMQAAAEAVAAGVTISLVGIALDDQGKELAEKLVDMGRGRLTIVKDISQLDVIVLEEYGAMR